MGLISQVSPDDRIVTPVVPGQHDPIMDPTRLGYLVRVPQIGPEIGGSVVAVKDNLQAMAAGTLDNPIHECQALQPLEVGVQYVVDPLRLARWVEELIAERQANSVEPRLLNLIEHILPVAGFQAVRGKGAGLQPEPVDPRQVHLAP